MPKRLVEELEFEEFGFGCQRLCIAKREFEVDLTNYDGTSLNGQQHYTLHTNTRDARLSSAPRYSNGVKPQTQLHRDSRVKVKRARTQFPFAIPAIFRDRHDRGSLIVFSHGVRISVWKVEAKLFPRACASRGIAGSKALTYFAVLVNGK